MGQALLSGKYKSPAVVRFAYDITELIHGPKIAFIDYNTEAAVIIENPIIAKFQKRLFRLLYQ